MKTGKKCEECNEEYLEEYKAGRRTEEEKRSLWSKDFKFNVITQT